MERCRTTTLIASFIVTCITFAQPPTVLPIAGAYIVTMQPSFAVSTVQAMIAANNVRPLRSDRIKDTGLLRGPIETKLNAFIKGAGIPNDSVRFRYVDGVVGFAATLTKAQVAALKANSQVTIVEQDFQIPLSPELFKVVKIPAQTITCAITNAGGFASGAAREQWIWIVDSGIDLDHPDLNVMALPAYAANFVPGTTSLDDCRGHGTHVAGIAAAKDNAFGVVGVSAGAVVVPVRVFGCSGPAPWSQIIAGINHTAGRAIAGDVVNLSLGAHYVDNCPTFSHAMNTCLNSLTGSGSFICMSAGNDNGDAKWHLPGCITGNRRFTIAAMECNKARASYTNLATGVTEWVATGTGVMSTYLNGTYATKDGTSMATPVVSGIVHQRRGAPVSGGTVTFDGVALKVAKLR